MNVGSIIEVLQPGTHLSRVAGIRVGSTGVVRQIVPGCRKPGSPAISCLYVQFDQFVKNGLDRRNKQEGLLIVPEWVKEIEDDI